MEIGTAPDWLQIQMTPPSLAAGSIQAAELQLLGEQLSRDPEVRLDADSLAGLAESGWLRQDVHARGAYLSTRGVWSRLEHPELVVLNVPSGAVQWAAETLNRMAAYLDESAARFAPGETYVELGDTVVGAFTFAPLDAEGAASIGLEGLDREFLVVLPLP
jgi:hypothetical protein